MRKAFRAGWPPAVVVILFLLLWEGIARTGWIASYLLPSPVDVAKAFAADRQLLLDHTLSTFGIAVVGFSIGCVFGLIVAVILHLVPVLRNAFAPLIILSQNVPSVVLAPLLVVWFGFGWMPKIVLLTIVCFFPVAIATMSGLERADRNMYGYMQMAGADRWQLFTKLELPWSLPSMFSGLKVASAYSILGAVIGEWSGAQKGLGIYLNLMQSGYRVDRMFVAILLIALLSLVMYYAMTLLEKWLVRWQK